jgi:tetratricopeptide (TPR) repeat protein
MRLVAAQAFKAMRRLLSSPPIRKLKHLSLLLAICVHSAGAVMAQESDVPDLVERVKPAVVYIVTTIRGKKEIGQGSGFFIRSDQIVSNWHVVEEAQSILVKTAEGAILKVRSVVATDREHDLALLQLEAPANGISTLEIASSLPREGERVIVVGNPKGLGWSMSDGRIASIRESKGGLKLLQITAPISPGSSGSPVVNMRGQVIGVAVGIKEGGQNLNFAISSEHIAKLYSESSDSAKLLPTPRTPTLSANSSGLDEPDSEVSPAALKLARSFYYQGSVQQSKNDCKGAISFFEKAVVVNPKLADAWFSLAFCKSETGRGSAGIEDYKRAVQLKPDLYDAHWNLALLYFENKRYREAAASFKQAISLKPDSVEGYFSLGLSYSYSSQIPEAIGSFKQVIRLKPDHAAAYYMLGRSFLYLGKYADATESFRRADLFKPSQPWTIYSWGLALTEQKSYGQAVDKLREAINLKSDFSEAYSALGHAYYRSKQYDLATAQYKKAIELKGDDIEPYQGLSNVFIALGKKDESVSLFRYLVAKKPDYPDALVMLGAALIQTGNESEAQNYIQQAYRLKPNDPEPRSIIAYNYTRTGNYEKATVELTEAIRLGPEDSVSYSSRGWNYLYARKGNLAVNDAMKFLALEGWRAEHSQYMVLVAHFGYRLERRDQDGLKVLSDCTSRCDATVWPYPIVRYLRNEISETTLMNSATDNDRLTEAHAYIGMNLSLLGPSPEALKHFKWIIESGNRDFTEYLLALSEINYLEGLPKSTEAAPQKRIPAPRRRRP